jgi:type III pantothenate kinase
MNLIIDVGNSFVKVAVYSKAKLLKKKVITHSNLIDTVDEFLKKHKSIERSIISSVGSILKKDQTQLEKRLNTLVLNNSTKLPFKNNYKTPKTLGVDRIALVSASVKFYSDRNVLIIDAGTCITYDFITDENQYLGGAISPGIRTRYKSLNNLTANLPLLETKAPKNIIGRSTEESIHSGVVNGIISEIDGVIDTYKSRYEDLTVILTGGDAKFLSKRLKNSIFANSNFLLDGLNYILEFNSN